MPLAPNANARCRQFSCHKRGGGFASPPDWDTPVAVSRRKWLREDLLLGDRSTSTTGWHPRATGGGGAWDGPWLDAPPAWAQLYRAVNAGDTETVEDILRRGGVDVNMVVSGVTPLLLAAVHNYDVTALSLLRAGADHSHVTPWGTALDVVRELGDEYLALYHVELLLEDAAAGEVTLSAP